MGWLDDVIYESTPKKSLSEEQRIEQEIDELLGWISTSSTDWLPALNYESPSTKPRTKELPHEQAIDDFPTRKTGCELLDQLQLEQGDSDTTPTDPLSRLRDAEAEQGQDFNFQSLKPEANPNPIITDLGELRRIAREILSGELKSSSLDEYRKAIASLNGQHWLTYANRHVVSKQRAGTLRAAWRRYQAENIISRLSQINQTSNKDEIKILRSQASEIAGALIKNHSPYQPPEHYEKKHVRGTRSSLHNAKPSWRDDTIYAASKRDQLAVAVIRLTGARPGEMCTTFMLERDEENPSHLRVIIQGEKVSDLTGAGQPWREITVETSVSPASTRIIKNAMGNSRSMISRIDSSEDAFSKRISAACLRAGHTSVSAKSFRHALSSDVKATRGSDAMLSIALGHVSEKSRQIYGHAAYGGKGKCPIIRAIAARDLNPASEKNFELPNAQTRAAIRSGEQLIDEASGEILDLNAPEW